MNSEGEPIDDAFASGAPALVGTTTGVVGAAPVSSDPAQRQSRPYEALLAGSLEKFESDHQGRGGGSGAGRSGVRPQTTGGTWKGSKQRRPLSSGPNFRPKSLGARGENDSNVLKEEDGGGREEKTRPRARPKTAGAGSGGVQGVLARMGGYEEVIVHPYWEEAGYCIRVFLLARAYRGSLGDDKGERGKLVAEQSSCRDAAIFLVEKVTIEAIRP